MQTFTLAWGRRNRRSGRGTGTDGSILCAGITRTGRIRQEHLSPNGNTNTRPGKANRRRMTTVPLGQMRLPAALVLCTLSFLLSPFSCHLPLSTCHSPFCSAPAKWQAIYETSFLPPRLPHDIYALDIYAFIYAALY